MTDNYNVVEARIVKALCALANNPDLNPAKAARDFDVPPQRLRYRLKTGRSKIENGGNNKRLSDALDLGLQQHLNKLEELGINARPCFIRGYADRLLIEANMDPSNPPQKVSDSWTSRFLDRNPQYKKVKFKALALDRKKTHDPRAIRDWYCRFQKCLIEYGILTADIYNMDETGFRIGVGRTHTVITSYNSTG